MLHWRAEELHTDHYLWFFGEYTLPSAKSQIGTQTDSEAPRRIGV